METEMPVSPQSLPLSLSKINLHIENVGPSVSRQSYEDLKMTVSPGAKVVVSRENSPPRARADSLWTQHQCLDRMAWMKTFQPNKKGGLVYLDQDMLKKQQGVIKEIMMQVGAQLLTGKLAVRISLPIRIFEPRTLLERVADGWKYAPTLLKKAALNSDPLERMRYVMAFVVGGFHFCIGQLKPFNPILGETYQAAYADGTQAFLEHVSHHPVRAAFTLVGPKGLYTLSGVYEFESVTSRNSIYNHQVGSVKIVFHDGHKITYTVPQIKMSGILFGDRVVELTGTAKFVDSSRHLAGELSFDANNGFLSKAQADDIKGHIVSTKKGANKLPLSRIRGSWLSHLECDGKVYWHVESEPVFEHQPVEAPLPSDSRYREDLIALKNGHADLAQQEKLRLEDLQREDHKRRENGITKRQ